MFQFLLEGVKITGSVLAAVHHIFFLFKRKNYIFHFYDVKTETIEVASERCFVLEKSEAKSE
ncbi:hypothetical protein HMPREF3291_20595 [Bacillus sp. HMSC76G11]|nr:hypothetical protein HMPREF3291_20595 [Bacillus sp. HMSC76G11]